MKTITCDHAQELIVGRIDEGLDSERNDLLDLHLTACADCRAFEQDARMMLGAVAADVPPEPDELYWSTYRTSLDAKLREKEPHRPWWRSLTFKGLAAFACAALIIVAVGLNLREEPTGPQLTRAEMATLIDELDRIYGPVPEEQPLEVGPAVASNGEMPRTAPLPPNVGFLPWFEVEDESDFTFL